MWSAEFAEEWECDPCSSARVEASSSIRRPIFLGSLEPQQPFGLNNYLLGLRPLLYGSLPGCQLLGISCLLDSMSLSKGLHHLEVFCKVQNKYRLDTD